MTKKLLLADDSITIQKVIGIIFATEDYQLQICDDGDQAFEKALETYPDLVIADINMPGKDGFELCRSIKSEGRLANTSVLLLPGTFDHFDESRAEAVGADGWISKPFESQALLDKVAQLLAAEPVRLAGSVAAAPELEPEAPAEFGMAEEPAETAAVEAGVDESVLGLDEMASLAEGGVEESVDEVAADDIWDAVSFEEEDLQAVADVAEEFSTAAEEPAATDLAAEAADFSAASEEADFVFSDEEEPLELTDSLEEESAPEGAPLELEEAAVVEESVAFDADEEPAEVLELVDEVVEEPFAADDESIVGLADSAALEEEEEILELAEEDVLAEEPIEGLLTAEEETTEEPFVVDEELAVEPEAEQEVVEGSFSAPQEGPEDSFVDEQPVVEEPDVAALEEPMSVAAETVPDELDMAAAPEPDYAEPIAVAATSAVVADEPDVTSPIEQAEQQLRELSEEDLREVVARVAGPTIEKLASEMLEQIVWEVVPDLAESMIREEIRKIRQGAE